jgi:hypothetical protein
MIQTSKPVILIHLTIFKTNDKNQHGAQQIQRRVFSRVSEAPQAAATHNLLGDCKTSNNFMNKSKINTQCKNTQGTCPTFPRVCSSEFSEAPQASAIGHTKLINTSNIKSA